MERAGVLLATGLIVGDSMFGLFYAGAVAGVGADALALVGDGFAPLAGPVAVAVGIVALLWSYRRTKSKTLAALG